MAGHSKPFSEFPPGVPLPFSDYCTVQQNQAGLHLHVYIHVHEHPYGLRNRILDDVLKLLCGLEQILASPAINIH